MDVSPYLNQRLLGLLLRLLFDMALDALEWSDCWLIDRASHTIITFDILISQLYVSMRKIISFLCPHNSEIARLHDVLHIYEEEVL